MKRHESQICQCGQMLGKEEKSISLETTDFLLQPQASLFIQFSENIDRKRMTILSFKMRNVGFEIFFQFGLRIESDHAISLKIDKLLS